MAKRTPRKRVVATTTAAPSSNTRTMMIYGTVALGVVAIVGLLYLALREPPGIRDVMTYISPSRDHDNTLVYDGADLPRPGGPHHDIWLNCGVYLEPVNEANALHSLEHGAVWITYNPNLPANQISMLEQIGEQQSYVIVSPYPSQKSPVALTAWATQLELDSANDRRVEQFVERYVQGPQTPERGATCSGGIGKPIG